MARRILVLDGHPDPRGEHFVHGLATAYREAAQAAGHEVRTIAIASLARMLKADLAELGAASAIDLRFGSRVILRDDPPSSGDEATGARGGVRPSNRGRAG
jgi:putative NADPH-quinone reductase